VCLISGNNLLTIHVIENHFDKACVIQVLIIALLWHTQPSGLTLFFFTETAFCIEAGQRHNQVNKTNTVTNTTFEDIMEH